MGRKVRYYTTQERILFSWLLFDNYLLKEFENFLLEIWHYQL